MAESETDIRMIYLTGELLGVYDEDFGENWLCYNGTALYFDFPFIGLRLNWISGAMSHLHWPSGLSWTVWLPLVCVTQWYIGL